MALVTYHHGPFTKAQVFVTFGSFRYGQCGVLDLTGVCMDYLFSSDTVFPLHLGFVLQSSSCLSPLRVADIFYDTWPSACKLYLPIFEHGWGQLLTA